MSHRSSVRIGAFSPWVRAIASLLVLTVSKSVCADPARCAEAFEEGQRERRGGRILSAIEKFAYCAGPECPSLMHADCQKRLDEAEAAAPSLVVRAPSAGELDVTFSLDGAAPQTVNGQALRLDPGPHTISAAVPGYSQEKQRFILSEGEKLKAVELTLTPLAAREQVSPATHAPASVNGSTESADSAAAPAASPWWPWAVTSGVVATGSLGFAYFGLHARSGEHDLAECSPDCSNSRVADVKRDYLLANVSLGVALTGLSAMAVWYFVRPTERAAKARVNARRADIDLKLGSHVELTIPF
jgi:hypothetical protein